eukprot:CAMPEP_0174715050 /NCGR_PEP_ID=MMETSP1094-20130205/19984_1 /TAXON_ID=156173 /ORGANISM="Chrysochromulina brevifilum, Strain UTEX LB 985" /LENGTH=208 /DNA_ID=CAMNT_0015914549 /DNA_START=30 /DNA_END=656 /DNA_ORIENTATION=+
MVEVEETTAPAPGEAPPMSKAEMREKARLEWVRGWDHVVPIDYTHGNYCGPVEKAREMLDSGEVGVNDVDSCMGLTPLMKAARRNHIPVIELLLERKADVNAKDNMGETAIVKAKRNDHNDAIALLLKHGAEDMVPPPIPQPPFRIEGYELKPCGTPEQQAAMIAQVERRRAREDPTKRVHLPNGISYSTVPPPPDSDEEEDKDEKKK